MQSVTIKWRGLGYQNVFQAHVYLYDAENHLLLTTETYDNKITVCLTPNKVYKVIAISKDEILKNIFYVDSCQTTYTFYFLRSIFKGNPVIRTFHVSDFYYKNLPIEKGKIILWLK